MSGPSGDRAQRPQVPPELSHLAQLLLSPASEPSGDAQLSRSRFLVKQCSSLAVAFCLLLTTALYFIGQVDGLKLLIVALMNRTVSSDGGPSNCPEPGAQIPPLPPI